MGTVKERILSWMPKFELYLPDRCIGCIRREFTLFRPQYRIDCNGWQVRGDLMEWDYTIEGPSGALVASISKQLLHWTDTYVIDVIRPEDALCALMVVLAIDAEKCSRD